MTNTPRALVLCAVVVVAMLAGPASIVGPVGAAESATITASPNTVGAMSTHTVVAQVEDEDASQSLRMLNVDYNSAARAANVEGVSAEDVQSIGVDTNGDGAIDQSLSSSFTEIEYTNNFRTITFNFDGTYTLQADDAIVVTYANVENPVEPGEFQTQVSINHESTDHPAIASLVIVNQETQIESASVDPSTVSPGETVSNQVVTFTVSDVTADGDSDTFHVEFPDALADSLSPNSADVVSGSASITSSIEVVDGPDNDTDGVDRMDTLRFQTNDDSGGLTDLTLTVDTGVSYPSDATDGQSYDIGVWVDDSDDSDAYDHDAASVAVSGSSGGTSAPGATDTTGADDDDSDDTTTAASDDDDSDDSGGDATPTNAQSSGGVPGFTVAIGLVSLVVAGLLAFRRER